ncbi:MAG: histidinol-phosphate transaminase [bacterium]|nr:histidinol-phosphate transaminase [bacterium]
MIHFKDELKSIKNYIPGKPIEEVKRELGLKGRIIKLASNENPLGISPKAKKAILSSIGSLNLYPDDTNYYLKKKISEKIGVEEKHVIVGNGSVELINNIVFSFTRKHDNLLRCDPSFIMFSISGLMNGCNVISVPTNNFTFDVDEMIRKSEEADARIVYFDNPNNPMGSMVNQEKVEYLMKRINKERIVILDEAYNEYMSKNDRIDSGKLLRKHKNIVILRTFSKIYGLAGLRIGYGIANDEIMEVLNKVRLPFNVNLLAQKAALAAIDDSKHLSESKKLNDQGINYLTASLNKMGFFVVPSFTNFVSFDTLTDASVIFKKLESRGIIVRPIANYGLKSFLRVTTGTESDNKKFIKTLKEVM